jgi:hypothetical protein
LRNAARIIDDFYLRVGQTLLRKFVFFFFLDEFGVIYVNIILAACRNIVRTVRRHESHRIATLAGETRANSRYIELAEIRIRVDSQKRRGARRFSGLDRRKRTREKKNDPISPTVVRVAPGRDRLPPRPPPPPLKKKPALSVHIKII